MPLVVVETYLLLLVLLMLHGAILLHYDGDAVGESMLFACVRPPLPSQIDTSTSCLSAPAVRSHAVAQTGTELVAVNR